MDRLVGKANSYAAGTSGNGTTLRSTLCRVNDGC
jgi:hypothetical protein